MRRLAEARRDETGGGAIKETRAGGLGGEGGGGKDLDVARGGGVDDANGAAREGAEFFRDGGRASATEEIEGDRGNVGGAGATGGLLLDIGGEVRRAIAERGVACKRRGG